MSSLSPTHPNIPGYHGVPRTPSSSPHISVHTAFSSPSSPSRSQTDPADPVNPPGLLRFRPTRLRTPAPSPMRRAACSARERFWETREAEVEVDTEVGIDEAEAEGEFEVGSTGVDVERGPETQSGFRGVGTPFTSRPGLLNGRRYTVPLSVIGPRESAWRAPRPRTPVPSPASSEESEGGASSEQEIEVECEDEKEIECETRSNDRGDNYSESSEEETIQSEVPSREVEAPMIEGAVGLGPVSALVRNLTALESRRPFGEEDESQFIDVAWLGGSSEEESSVTEEVTSEDICTEEEVSFEGEGTRGDSDGEDPNEIAEPREEEVGYDSGRSIHMVSHREYGGSTPILSEGGEEPSDLDSASDEAEEPEDRPEPMLFGSRVHFLHLPLVDRPRRGRGPRGPP